MEPRLSLVLRDNLPAEGEGNMSKVTEETATPSTGDKNQNVL